MTERSPSLLGYTIKNKRRIKFQHSEIFSAIKCSIQNSKRRIISNLSIGQFRQQFQAVLQFAKKTQTVTTIACIFIEKTARKLNAELDMI